MGGLVVYCTYMIYVVDVMSVLDCVAFLGLCFVFCVLLYIFVVSKV
jgi:hypothetical protein